jgi:phosphodiesterase/alkaline phosphatase D-like protein
MNFRRIFLLGTITLLMASVAIAQNAKNTSNDGLKITKGPVVEHASATTAVIAWSTNVSSSTVVKYGTDQNNLTQIAQTPWGSLTHRVTIKNLEPGKTYYFQVDSGQALGTGGNATSQVGTFNTPSQ